MSYLIHHSTVYIPSTGFHWCPRALCPRKVKSIMGIYGFRFWHVCTQFLWLNGNRTKWFKVRCEWILFFVTIQIVVCINNTNCLTYTKLIENSLGPEFFKQSFVIFSKFTVLRVFVSIFSAVASNESSSMYFLQSWSLFFFWFVGVVLSPRDGCQYFTDCSYWAKISIVNWKLSWFNLYHTQKWRFSTPKLTDSTIS